MKRDMDEDIHAWAARERLSRETAHILEDQGFRTVNDLKDLSPDDVTDVFQKSGLMKAKDCLDLKKAIGRLSRQFEHLSMGREGQVPAAAIPSKGFLGKLFGFSESEPKETFRFLMLGKTGSGKSTTGNTILGEDKFPTSVRFSSVTTDCELHKTNKKGRLIEIMDCPGLYDTSKSQTAVASTIVQAVTCMHPGPHAILYISRLGRYTAEEFGVFQRLKALFDEHITDYMIVLFTGGDDLEREKTTLTQLLIDAPKDLHQVIQECKHRCHVFNNTAKNKKPQVEELLEEVRKLTIAHGTQPHYHCPKYALIGKNVEAEVERRLAEVTKRDLEKDQHIQKLEAETKQAREAIEKLKADMERKEKERIRESQQENEKRKKKEEKLQKELEAKHESEERMKIRERELQERLKQEREEFSRQQEEQKREERQNLKERQEALQRLIEQKQEEDREERRRTRQAYQEEMDRFKQEVANNENKGFIEKAAGWVMGGLRKIKDFFL